MPADPTSRSSAVLAEDVDAIAEQLKLLGADESTATLREASRRLDPTGREESAAPPLTLPRDELVDRFTAAVENVCDVAAIEVEVHELEVAPHGWRRDGRTSPLRRLVRAMEGAGLLDYSAVGEDVEGDESPDEDASAHDELLIVRMPGRKSGRPTIRHSRLPVETVLGYIEAGEGKVLIQQAWPSVTDEQYRVLEALAADLQLAQRPLPPDPEEEP